jgi:hypothetical protein
MKYSLNKERELTHMRNNPNYSRTIFPHILNLFSSNLCVQTSSEAHPASCTMGTRGPLPRAKHSWGVTLTTHLPSSAEFKNE